MWSVDWSPSADPHEPCVSVHVCVCAVDHPFVASLYGTIQTGTHLHFLMEYCEGGELYGLLTTQPTKRLKEAHMRFYVAEVPLPAFPSPLPVQ